MEGEGEVEERSYSPIQEVRQAPASSSSSSEARNNFYPLVPTISHGVSTRTTPPADYTFKIEGFSVISLYVGGRIHERYMSSTFEVGDYKWRLDLYPTGDTKRNIDADGYISLYLVAVETNKLPIGWEVIVDFKLFVYNQIQDEYYTVQDAAGRLARFNQMNTENGFPKLISQVVFNNASKGFLVDDSCIFGVEVFVIRNNTRKVESLSAFNCSQDIDRFTWKLLDFTKINVGCYKSGVFSAANRKWTIEVCNREKPSGKKYLALYLYLITTDNYFVNLKFWKWLQKCNNKTFPQEGDFWLECNFRVKDQVNGNHREKKVCSWFRVKSNQVACELENFLLLDHLNDPSKGFLLNDSLVVDVRFDRIREVKNILEE